ncbi:ribosome small subunit-dependent GTPase A [Chlorobaculum thiosulfatiphilum]|uniref:Small ribosomal subunit biogenesis GTPase RsgA n=1 Tax=Chlorobaculum thiosulfatiphilum TaxID=115852 RepID=A0A5C4S710_CHLTI|nr:ribosome small subunit-dependent GTPase A [Chlorobaculum thiosulfatiphilum]TNJ39323.1 ribosome small subunit-dependent GTPase A [Chlorobaculum thiosulfatiphilum]
MNETLSGVVTRVTGASYIVETGDGLKVRCRTVPSTVSENEGANLVAVGDRVEFRLKASETDMAEGVIVRVEERRTSLVRRREVRRNRSKEKEQVIVANIDQLVLITSFDDPPFNSRLVDRYLVFAESEKLPLLIVVNKIDLDEEGMVEDDLEVYRELGCNICLVSAEDGRGIEELRELLRDRMSAFSGHSGVGKSTIINLLVGREELRTAETSNKTGKGVHTTTSSAMFPLPGGGYVIDTPGIREFNLSGITRENLRFYYTEFLRYMPECAFSSCSHTVEPGCAVIAAVESEAIDAGRYESYLALLDSLDE